MQAKRRIMRYKMIMTTTMMMIMMIMMPRKKLVTTTTLTTMRLWKKTIIYRLRITILARQSPLEMMMVQLQRKKLNEAKQFLAITFVQPVKNRNTPAHWIYDCPDKITVRGANQKKKKDRGVHDPDSKKVFVSGLPFEANAKKVEDFFSTTHNCGIVSCVGLIKFDDSKRCNGQAYVTFNTDEGAKLALELTGITINAAELSSDVNDAKKKKKNSKEGEESSDVVVKRKELKLKVSKVRGRNETKPHVRSLPKDSVYIYQSFV